MEFIATKVQIFYNCSLLDNYKNGKKAIKLYALKIKLIFALSGNDLAKKKFAFFSIYQEKNVYLSKESLPQRRRNKNNRNI